MTRVHGRTRPLLALVLALLVPQGAAATGTHAVAKAALTYRPQRPIVGRPWELMVSIESSDRSLHPARRVRVIGEMSGHPMRPVEAELPRVGETVFAGSMAFTMCGPWRLTLRVEDLNDVLVATYDLEVVKDDASIGFDEMRALVDLHQPVRPNLFPPGVVVATVAGLMVAFELVAVGAKRRRRTSALGLKPDTTY